MAHDVHTDRDARGAAPTGSAAPAQAVFDVRGLEVALGGQRVLGPLDLEVRQGSFIGILGPNGSGKTTLLRALTGTVKPTAGTTLLEGRPLGDYRATELARRVGVVPQQFYLDFSFTVREMVSMGRYAHPRHEERRGNDASAGDDAAGPWKALSLRPASPIWRAGW